jgi:hypothetical protein
MTLPGFNAEASVYKVKWHYYTTSVPNQISRISEGIGLAQWDGDDNCSYCLRFEGVARRRCFCTCSGGWWINGLCA